MRISRLRIFHVQIRLRKPIRHASHTRTDTDSIVVRCELGDGTVGWGEGLPRDYVTGETIDDAWRLLTDADLTREFGGEQINLSDLVATRLPVQLSPRHDDPRGCFGNSVRCAIELSVLDAFCRLECVPLSSVTSLLPETLPIRRSQPKVRYSAAFTAMTPAKQIKRALTLRLCGFHQAKIKTGVAGVDDTALLARLRWWLGPRFDLRIDANEAWRCSNLEQQLAPLLSFGISSVEQPVPHEEVGGLAALRGRLGVPLMLDESLCSLIDAQRAIELGICDLFNIRLSKCGGFINSLRLATMAHQAGLGYQLGCQVGETGILSAAGRHFASSVANIRYVEGSYDRFLVKDRLTQQDLTFGWGGYAAALTEPGLGVQIAEQALKRVTMREMEISI